MTQWGGATAVVTGAARGLGRGITLEAIRRGGKVVAWDVDEVGLAELRAAAEQLRPGAVRTDVVDVTDEHAVAEAGALALAAGPVDIVVNNAGVVSGQDITDLRPEAVRRTMGVNVFSLFWTARVFLPPMVARNSGHVVTVASLAGITGSRRLTDYSASKHAAVGFDAALRAELHVVAPKVRTTVVNPFFIDTGMFQGVQAKSPWLLPLLEPDDVIDRVIRAVEDDDRRVFIPPVARAMYLALVLPTAVGDKILDLLGVHESMDDFQGHARKPVDDGAGDTAKAQGRH